MPLTFSQHTESSLPLEVDELSLEKIRSLSTNEIAKILITRGNQQLPFGDFFRISGSMTEDDTVIWDGNCHNVKRIGWRLTQGTIRITGDAGMHLGAEMKGGSIHCEGNAADWLGAEMKGGLIRVNGHAGNLVGSVYRGGRKGMMGGTILIDGNAGHEIGHAQRRGMIAVRGNIGDFAGLGMIAGSILAFGNSGVRSGAGMKRGTIALLGSSAETTLLPSFRKTGIAQPTILRVCFRFLNNLGFPVAEHFYEKAYQQYRGDLLELGHGEIFLPVA